MVNSAKFPTMFLGLQRELKFFPQLSAPQLVDYFLKVNGEPWEKLFKKIFTMPDQPQSKLFFSL
jgi:hypothetical protein